MINEDSNESNGERKLHALIVDDDAQDFELISSMIHSHTDMDYKFYWAKNSEEAKAILADLWIDIVAVDYNLGNELGTEVIKTLSNLYPHIAYIMITGMEDPDLYKLGLAAGASDFIVKDDDNAKLFNKTVQFAVKNKRIQNNLKAANESKKRLMSLISEELETPLSDLVKSLTMLKSRSEHLTKYEIEDFLTDAYRSSHAALAAIYSVIEWGNNKTETTKVHIEMVNFSDLVSSVFKLLAIEAERKAVELCYHGDSGLKVYTDGKMLNVLIRTLITNAIHSATSGDTIDILTNVSNSVMNISIRNSRLVIPHDQVTKLRLGESEEDSEKNPERGRTNKMDICRHLLDLMGTSLQIESSTELGTRFAFELPIDFPKIIQDIRISPPSFDIPY